MKMFGAEDDDQVKLLVAEDCPMKCLEISRHLLARNSPEFQRRLVNKRTMKNNDTITIENVTFDSLQQMVSFIKTEKVPDDLTTDQMAELLCYAKRYEMKALAFQCECDLMKRVTADTVCRIYETANRISNQTLRRWCMTFLRREVVSLKEKIADLSAASLKELLSLNLLNVPGEAAVLQIVLLWARSKSLALNHRDVSELLDCVRWKFLTKDEIETIDPDELDCYRSLANDCKTNMDNDSLKSWNSDVFNDSGASETDSIGRSNSKLHLSETGRSPVVEEAAGCSEPSENKPDPDEDCFFFNREAFARINNSCRRSRASVETENSFLRLYRSGRWRGSEVFCSKRRRQTCTSYENIFLPTSGNKDWPRKHFQNLIPGISSSTKRNRDVFQNVVQLPHSVERNYKALKGHGILCLVFSVRCRMHLHQVVLELQHYGIISVESVSGFEVRVRRKTPHLQNTYGTVGVLKLQKNDLVNIISLGCNLYEVVCEFPRPIVLSDEALYRIELAVGDCVFCWREGSVTNEEQQLLAETDQPLYLQEQTTLAVTKLCLSVYD